MTEVYALVAGGLITCLGLIRGWQLVKALI